MKWWCSLCIDIGWFSKRFHLAFLESSWFPRRKKKFSLENKDKGLSLSKLSWYLVIVKIIRIRHLNGHISQKKPWFRNYFHVKKTLQWSCTCAKFLSFCEAIFTFSCIFSSHLWRTVLRNTLYFFCPWPWSITQVENVEPWSLFSKSLSFIGRLVKERPQKEICDRQKTASSFIRFFDRNETL